MGWDNPKLWPAMFYGFVFAAGWMLVQFGSGMWNVLGNALALVGGLLMGITVLIYIGHWMTFFIDVIMQAFTKTKASTLARELQGLTQEQVSIVRSQGEISLGEQVVDRAGHPRDLHREVLGREAHAQACKQRFDHARHGVHRVVQSGDILQVDRA